MRKYVITDASNVSNFDFNLLVDSAETSRYSVDNSKILARFEGDTPSFLAGETQYTNEEVLPILAGAEWAAED